MARDAAGSESGGGRRVRGAVAVVESPAVGAGGVVVASFDVKTGEGAEEHAVDVEVDVVGAASGGIGVGDADAVSGAVIVGAVGLEVVDAWVEKGDAGVDGGDVGIDDAVVDVGGQCCAQW
jgi:hypothetical protein